MVGVTPFPSVMLPTMVRDAVAPVATDRHMADITERSMSDALAEVQASDLANRLGLGAACPSVI